MEPTTTTIPTTTQPVTNPTSAESPSIHPSTRHKPFDVDVTSTSPTHNNNTINEGPVIIYEEGVRVSPGKADLFLNDVCK